MFEWSAERIRFLVDASEYAPFNDLLAERACAYLSPDMHVCDMGCGLGYLSLALAKRVRQVSAVDCSQAALAVLREKLLEGQVANVDVYNSDALTLPPLHCDAMVCCFFGSTNELLELMRRQGVQKALLFKKNWATHRFTPKEAPLERYTFLKTLAELDALGVLYKSESFPAELGQPLRSLEEAAVFLRLNSRDQTETLTKEELLKRLTPTGRTDFPYYLSAKRPVGLIVLDAAADTSIKQGGIK